MRRSCDDDIDDGITKERRAEAAAGNDTQSWQAVVHATAAWGVTMHRGDTGHLHARVHVPARRAPTLTRFRLAVNLRNVTALIQSTRY